MNVLPRQPSVNANIQKKANCKGATHARSKISITWTVEDDATIVSIIVGGSSYAKIASAIGKG